MLAPSGSPTPPPSPISSKQGSGPGLRGAPALAPPFPHRSPHIPGGQAADPCQALHPTWSPGPRPPTRPGCWPEAAWEGLAPGGQVTSPQSPRTQTQARRLSSPGASSFTCQSHTYLLPSPSQLTPVAPSHPLSRTPSHCLTPTLPLQGGPAQTHRRGAGGGSEGGAGGRARSGPLLAQPSCAHSPRHQARGSGHSTCAQRSLRLRGQEAHTRPTPGPGASPGGIDLHPLGTPGGRPVAEALRSSCDRSCSRSSTMGRPALRELTVHPGGGQPERSSPDGNVSLEAPHTRVHGDHARAFQPRREAPDRNYINGGTSIRWDAPRQALTAPTVLDDL